VSGTGYVHSIIPYYGNITEVYNLLCSDKPFTIRILLSLMDHLGLSVYGLEGWHIFTDWYYSSADLAKELNAKECHITHHYWWKSWQSKASEDEEWWYFCVEKSQHFSDGVRRQKVVLMISVYHDRSKGGRLWLFRKGPINGTRNQCVYWMNYMENMDTVSCNAHYCATHSSICKCLKWWRKLFLVPEVCLVNSYIL
jgi:hypothetical protein